eukprot:gnl/Chilomastix_caulleri/6690.p1 GENE.gnl/Chilomastix_caulleri/6690~~gnl/Chilomastix_caulleri/6690.p1  ORF type:complete len:131 (-),score=29.53 gnl/Chilomastix_caulleri/6690:37-429(-)
MSLWVHTSFNRNQSVVVVPICNHKGVIYNHTTQSVKSDEILKSTFEESADSGGNEVNGECPSPECLDGVGSNNKNDDNDDDGDDIVFNEDKGILNILDECDIEDGIGEEKKLATNNRNNNNKGDGSVINE